MLTATAPSSEYFMEMRKLAKFENSGRNVRRKKAVDAKHPTWKDVDDAITRR